MRTLLLLRSQDSSALVLHVLLKHEQRQGYGRLPSILLCLLLHANHWRDLIRWLHRSVLDNLLYVNCLLDRNVRFDDYGDPTNWASSGVSFRSGSRRIRRFTLALFLERDP